MPNVTSPKEIAASLTEIWSPRVAAQVDDAYIKVAKVHWLGIVMTMRTSFS